MTLDDPTSTTATVRMGDAVALVSTCRMHPEDLRPTLDADVRWCPNCAQRVFNVEDSNGLRRAVAQRRCIATQDLEGRLVVGEARSPYAPGSQLSWDM